MRHSTTRTMDPDLRDLAAFATVARHRSFRRAAAELQISPSALSENLRDLEERLGVRLLNRTTRSVAPTEAGERLLTRLTPALRDVDSALEGVDSFRDRPAGAPRLDGPGGGGRAGRPPPRPRPSSAPAPQPPRAAP